MPDSAKPAEIEDVLSSIRRLVAGGGAAPGPVVAPHDTPSPALDGEDEDAEPADPSSDVEPVLEAAVAEDAFTAPKPDAAQARMPALADEAFGQDDALGSTGESDNGQSVDGAAFEDALDETVEAELDDVEVTEPDEDDAGSVLASVAATLSAANGADARAEDAEGDANGRTSLPDPTALLLTPALRVGDRSTQDAGTTAEASDDLSDAPKDLEHAGPSDWIDDAQRDSAAAEAISGKATGDASADSPAEEEAASPSFAFGKQSTQDEAEKRDTDGDAPGPMRRSPFLSQALQEAQRQQQVRAHAEEDRGDGQAGGVRPGFGFGVAPQDDPTRHIPLNERGPRPDESTESDSRTYPRILGPIADANGAAGQDLESEAPTPSVEAVAAQEATSTGSAPAPSGNLNNGAAPDDARAPNGQPTMSPHDATGKDRVPGAFGAVSSEGDASDERRDEKTDQLRVHGPIIASDFARRPASQVRGGSVPDASATEPSQAKLGEPSGEARKAGPNAAHERGRDVSTGGLRLKRVVREGIKDGSTGGNATPQTSMPASGNTNATNGLRISRPDAVSREPVGENGADHVKHAAEDDGADMLSLKGTLSNGHGASHQERSEVASERSTEGKGLASAVSSTPGAPSTERSDEDNLFGDGQTVDEAALRALISDVVRVELQGALGERVTRNIRRLIQAEIARALNDRDVT